MEVIGRRLTQLFILTLFVFEMQSSLMAQRIESVKVAPGAWDEIHVKWNYIATNTSAERFFVERSDDNGVSWVRIATCPNHTPFVYIDKNPNFVRNQAYAYRVVGEVQGGNGLITIVSPSASVTMKKNFPSLAKHFHIRLETPTKATLTWSVEDVVNDDQWLVERSNSSDHDFYPIQVLGKQSNCFDDLTLSLGQTYFYRVTAINSFGQSPASKVLSIAAANIPEAPSGLTAVALSHDSIQLSWSGQDQAVAGYKIERASLQRRNVLLLGSTLPQDPFLENSEISEWIMKMRSLNQYQVVAKVPPNQTIFVDRNLDINSTYYYEVSAFNSAGLSLPSNETSAQTLFYGETIENPPVQTTPSVVLTPPVDLEKSLSNKRSNILRWSKSNGAAPELYCIERSIYSAEGPFSILMKVDSSQNRFVDENVQKDRVYYYRVAAGCNDGSTSRYSRVLALSPRDPVAPPLPPLPSLPPGNSVGKVNFPLPPVPPIPQRFSKTTFELKP